MLTPFSTIALLCALSFFHNAKAAVPAWKLRMRPVPSVIPPDVTVTIRCQADANTPLAECGFQINRGVYFDASMGAATPPLQEADYSLEYYGTGLEKGQCGVTLKAKGQQYKTLNVGCRGRTQDGEWKYDYMTFLVKNTVVPAWKLRMRPVPSVIRPDVTVNILCQAEANTPLAKCGFQVNHGVYFDASKGAATPPLRESDYTLEYYGTGLEKGQCGVTLKAKGQQHETLNVGCRGRTEHGKWKYDYMKFLVKNSKTTHNENIL